MAGNSCPLPKCGLAAPCRPSFPAFGPFRPSNHSDLGRGYPFSKNRESNSGYAVAVSKVTEIRGLRNKELPQRGIQSISRIEHAPGPRGSPQDPQAPMAGEALALPFVATAKVEICGASFLLWHLGHSAFRLP